MRIGAYKPGADRIWTGLCVREMMREFMMQTPTERVPYAECLRRLAAWPEKSKPWPASKRLHRFPAFAKRKRSRPAEMETAIAELQRLIDYAHETRERSVSPRAGGFECANRDLMDRIAGLLEMKTERLHGEMLLDMVDAARKNAKERGRNCSTGALRDVRLKRWLSYESQGATDANRKAQAGT